MMCGDRHGNAGEFFAAPYMPDLQHDGRLRSIPMMESGYAAPATARQPGLSMKGRGARRELPRLRFRRAWRRTGPALAEFLGRLARRLRRHVRPRAAGEVEIVPNCFRVIQPPTGRSPREPARRPASLGGTSPPAAPRTRSKSDREAHRQSAAVHHTALGVRDGTIDESDKCSRR